MLITMRLPDPRGPLGEALFRDLVTRTTLSGTTIERAGRRLATDAALTDEDLQLSLAACYELSYRGFDDVSDDWEWDPRWSVCAAGWSGGTSPRSASAWAPCRRPRSRSTVSWPR